MSRRQLRKPPTANQSQVTANKVFSVNRTRRKSARRRGLTLAELLVASTIMLMIATAVATLGSAVHSTNDFCRGYTTSGQHARVALSRIERAVLNAKASEAFPGCIVVTEQAGSQELPSTP